MPNILRNLGARMLIQRAFGLVGSLWDCRLLNHPDCLPKLRCIWIRSRLHLYFFIWPNDLELGWTFTRTPQMSPIIFPQSLDDNSQSNSTTAASLCNSSLLWYMHISKEYFEGHICTTGARCGQIASHCVALRMSFFFTTPATANIQRQQFWPFVNTRKILS